MELSFQLKMNATSSQVWEYYENLDKWFLWEKDLTAISLEGEFITGAKGTMVLEGMLEMAIELDLVIKNQVFRDITLTPVGLIAFTHTIEEVEMGVLVKHSVKIDTDNKEVLPMLTSVFKDVPETMFLLKEVVEANGI